MKILVTGNMGYVGSVVVRRLRSVFPEATLLGLDTGFFSHCLTNADFLPECQADAQYFGDVRSFPKSLLDGIDAVVHLAAISNDPMGNRFERVTLDINYGATAKLAAAAKSAGVSSFVFASSCSVYGAAENGPRGEKSPVNPLTAYARSKVLAEEALERLADRSFRATSLRFATACGMSDRLRLDLVLNDFVASACSTAQIKILSDGSPWRPLINVQDMARAIEWAIGRPLDAGGAFLVMNTGSDQWNYQIRELAAAVADNVPGTRVSIDANAQPDKRSYRVDFSLFRKLAPCHQPEFDLVGTIRDLRRGLESMDFHDADFRNSSLMRLTALSDLRNRGLITDNLEWTNRAAHGSLAACAVDRS